jgi:hypothetical protein
MRLGERAPTALAAVAALSPAQPDRLAGDRQIAHSDHRALLDVEGAAPAARAACGSRHQLDLEVELVATLDEGLHLEAVQADEAANVALHPAAVPPGSAIHDHAEPCEGSRMDSAVHRKARRSWCQGRSKSGPLSPVEKGGLAETPGLRA